MDQVGDARRCCRFCPLHYVVPSGKSNRTEKREREREPSYSVSFLFFFLLGASCLLDCKYALLADGDDGDSYSCREALDRLPSCDNRWWKAKADLLQRSRRSATTRRRISNGHFDYGCRTKCATDFCTSQVGGEETSCCCCCCYYSSDHLLKTSTIQEVLKRCLFFSYIVT